MLLHRHRYVCDPFDMCGCQPAQAAMQAGLDVFAMDSPEHKELKDVEKDLNLMEQVSGYYRTRGAK